MLNSLLPNVYKFVFALIAVSFFTGCSKPDFDLADGLKWKTF